MSELVNNLQEIYNIKLQIKDVLGTESDLFSDYPDLIEEAIGEGGGGSATPVDPWYNGTSVYDMIVNEEESADYVYTEIGENFTVTIGEDESQNEIVEAIEWDFPVDVEENNESVSKTVHVIVNGGPHEQFGEAETIAQAIEDYPDLEDEMIFPILENATLTASEDPSEDGYDYLLEGDIYAWNLNNNVGGVMEITENGFYANGACLGYNVNVPNDVDLYHYNDLWADVIENEVFNEEITVLSEISDSSSFYKNYENNIITNYTWKNYQYDGNGDLVATVYISVNNPYTDGTDVFEYLPDEITVANPWPNHYAVLSPILQGVLTPRETTGLYDFEGKILYHDARPSYQVVTITENGFYNPNGGMNVNVPSVGLSEGTYNIFNFLEYGLQYGMVELNNKPYEEINLYNLGPVNYIDPMDGMETKNQYVEMTLWDNPQMDTEVEFENVTGDATSSGDDHWYQFNELSQSSDADEFMAVHIDVYDWAYDIDPDTQMDAGSWEVSDTYIAVFENTYTDDGDGAWTYTIRFYYDNNNNEWVVDLYQNGVLVEEGVSAFAQQ